ISHSIFHGSLQESLKSSESDGEEFNCPKCNMTFAADYAFMTHFEIVHVRKRQ
ncbi:6472_t:CDS:1, partial [Ambispora gerdemannii]